MPREEMYEEEFYQKPPEGGFQEYLNEALRQAPWWLISVAVHGAVALSMLMMSFTEYRDDKALVVESELEQKKEEKID
ncbi:MAG: hypothetical protein MUC63_02270, partial [Planctomycetes bacterium]|nr:hypothetical protein [Planctomycetota bacterium]